MLDSLEMESQATELGSSARVILTLNCLSVESRLVLSYNVRRVDSSPKAHVLKA